MAEDLIRLNGMEPYSDINIEFVGLRPGEKMFEELLTAEEGTTSTSHEKIFVARNITVFDEAELKNVIQQFSYHVNNGDSDMREMLSKYVPFYQIHA